MRVPRHEPRPVGTNAPPPADSSRPGVVWQAPYGIEGQCPQDEMADMKPALSHLRVVRTYSPQQNGAKRFARRYGSQLVCVRHRLDHAGTLRHTTVELVVESTPVLPRARADVAIRIPPDDRATRALLLACGARWQSRQKYWLLPQLVARNLRLLRYRVGIPG